MRVPICLQPRGARQLRRRARAAGTRDDARPPRGGRGSAHLEHSRGASGEHQSVQPFSLLGIHLPPRHHQQGPDTLAALLRSSDSPLPCTATATPTKVRDLIQSGLPRMANPSILGSVPALTPPQGSAAVPFLRGSICEERKHVKISMESH